MTNLEDHFTIIILLVHLNSEWWKRHKTFFPIHMVYVSGKTEAYNQSNFEENEEVKRHVKQVLANQGSCLSFMDEASTQSLISKMSRFAICKITIWA